MNLTRRIIEGIHEVELQVTPEFRKEPEGKLSVYHVHDLLKSLGWWQDEPDFTVGSDKGVMVQRTWAHPDIPGVRIVALRPTDKAGNVTVAHPYVAEVYSWKADWGQQPIEPNLKDIEDAVKFLVASHGLEKLGTMGNLVGQTLELDQKMEAVGWKVVAASGTGIVIVYERSGVRETIEVTEDDNHNIVSAEVSYPDGSTAVITPPTAENIVARAKALESWSH